MAISIGSLAIALDFAFESVQWVINAYVLAFSVCMVAGGTHGEFF